MLFYVEQKCLTTSGIFFEALSKHRVERPRLEAVRSIQCRDL